MSKTKKPPKIKGVKEVSRDPVLKTNCAFIRVAETGMLGENGRAVAWIRRSHDRRAG